MTETEKLKCEVCGEAKPTVTKRFCVYSEEVNGTQVEEIICDDCEREHLMDI